MHYGQKNQLHFKEYNFPSAKKDRPGDEHSITIKRIKTNYKAAFSATSLAKTCKTNCTVCILASNGTTKKVSLDLSELKSYLYLFLKQPDLCMQKTADWAQTGSDAEQTGMLMESEWSSRDPYNTGANLRGWTSRQAALTSAPSGKR